MESTANLNLVFAIRSMSANRQTRSDIGCLQVDFFDAALLPVRRTSRGQFLFDHSS